MAVGKQKKARTWISRVAIIPFPFPGISATLNAKGSFESISANVVDVARRSSSGWVKEAKCFGFQ